MEHAETWMGSQRVSHDHTWDLSIVLIESTGFPQRWSTLHSPRPHGREPDCWLLCTPLEPVKGWKRSGNRAASSLAVSERQMTAPCTESSLLVRDRVKHASKVGGPRAEDR